MQDFLSLLLITRGVECCSFELEDDGEVNNTGESIPSSSLAVNISDKSFFSWMDWQDVTPVQAFTSNLSITCGHGAECCS